MAEAGRIIKPQPLYSRFLNNRVSCIVMKKKGMAGKETRELFGECIVQEAFYDSNRSIKSTITKTTL